MKIAIAHDYLIQMGGAERVVEVFHDMYPEAPIFTTVFSDERLSRNLKDADIRATWLQNVPGVKTNFKGVLPLYPIAIRDFDFRDFDIVLSSSSAFMKSIQVPNIRFTFVTVTHRCGLPGITIHIWPGSPNPTCSKIC